MEIERKYLVDSLPEDLNAYPHEEIEQGYLCTSPTVRVRRMGDVYILTVKEKVAGEHRPMGGMEPIVNREEEFALTADAFSRLKEKCEGRMVLKTRYRIPLEGGLTAELDIFQGEHEGMLLVEVEFPDEATAAAFVPPEWFGKEVSDDRRYRNSYLAFN